MRICAHSATVDRSVAQSKRCQEYRHDRRSRARSGRDPRAPDHAAPGAGDRLRRDGAGQPRPLHRQRGAAGYFRRVRQCPARGPVVGAERLRHRLRRAAGVLRPTERTLPTRRKLPAGRRALHRGVGRLRRRERRAITCRLPARPGGRRRADDADLARPAARYLSPGGPRRRYPRLGVDRRVGRRVRAGRGRPAGDL